MCGALRVVRALFFICLLLCIMLVYIKKYKIKLIDSSTTLYNKKGIRINGRQKKYFLKSLDKIKISAIL